MLPCFSLVFQFHRFHLPVFYCFLKVLFTEVSGESGETGVYTLKRHSPSPAITLFISI